MGGSPGSAPNTDVDTRFLKRELGLLGDPNSQQNKLISSLMSGQLSPEESNAFAMALKTTDSGIENARQTAQQVTREGAAARGLFSSDIALGAEAAGLADVENQYAQNRAGLYQNLASSVKSNILTGLQASQNVYQQRQALAGGITTGSYQSGSLANQAYGNQLQYGTTGLKDAGSFISQAAPAIMSAAPQIMTMFSDINLKENILPIESALETIDKLNPVEFYWKGSEQKDYGVIAQEIEEVLPELVDSTGEYKKVNYNALIGILLRAVQELRAKVDDR